MRKKSNPEPHLKHNWDPSSKRYLVVVVVSVQQQQHLQGKVYTIKIKCDFIHTQWAVATLQR